MVSNRFSRFGWARAGVLVFGTGVLALTYWSPITFLLGLRSSLFGAAIFAYMYALLLRNWAIFIVPAMVTIGSVVFDRGLHFQTETTPDTLQGWALACFVANLLVCIFWKEIRQRFYVRLEKSKAAAA